MPILTLDDGTKIYTDSYKEVTPELVEGLLTQQKETVLLQESTLAAQTDILEELQALKEEVTE